jgi:catechol 2,3-dioxygenase-like lactoylglutathione lyase family enzyme
MSIELNRVIIPARSKWASATFLACILDVPAGPQRELFVPVRVGNGVILEYVDAEGFDSHHCAFLVSEAEFDAAFARIRSTGITYYAGPHHERPGEINDLRGGRGVYFDDPDGHNIEIITQPYGDPPTPPDGLTSTAVKVARSHGG